MAFRPYPLAMLRRKCNYLPMVLLIGIRWSILVASSVETKNVCDHPDHIALLQSPVHMVKLSTTDIEETLQFRHFENQFATGLQLLLTHQRFNHSEPLVVTALDGAYAKYLTPWSQRLRNLGLQQQIIIALDNAAEEVAVSGGLPALDVDGHLVTSSLKQRDAFKSVIETKSVRTEWKMPKDLATLKFMVPYLLLERDFDMVIFSEADVFMFDNPLTAFRPLAKSTDFAIMPNHPREGQSNIGFMMFKGMSSVPMLREFCQAWFEKERGDLVRVADQLAFNAILHQAAGVHKFDLPAPQFVQRPPDVTSATIVAHLAWANPRCKQFFLEQLYNGSLPDASALQKSYSALPSAIRHGAEGYHCVM